LFLSTRIMTALLSPTEMGRFSIIYAIMALCGALFITPVSTYIQRKILEWNTAGRVGFFSARYARYLLVVSVTVSLFVLLAKHLAGIGIHISDPWVMVVIFGLIYFANLNLYYYGALNIFQKRLWFTACQNLTLGLGLALAVFFVQTFSQRAEYWVLGQIAGQIVVLFLARHLFFRAIRSPADGEEVAVPETGVLIKEVAHFVWPLAVASLIIWVQSQCYPFVMQSLNGIAVVGLFSVGFNLGLKLTAKCESLLMAFYDPIFYSDIAHSDAKARIQAWNRYAGIFIPAMVLLCCYICAGGPFIARIFLAEQFRAISGNIVFWGGATSLVMTIVGLYKNVGIASLKMTGLIGPYILGAVVTITGIYAFSAWDPYHGAGLALFLGSLAILIYLMIKMHNLLAVTFPLGRLMISCGYALPMIGVLLYCRRIFPGPTLWQALAILVLTGFYQLGAQALLARKWFLKT